MNSRLSAGQFVARLSQTRAVAILRCDDEGLAAAAMEGAIRGGFTIVEFTLTIPSVFALIRRFSQRDGLVVGAGTVLSTAEVEKALAAGAQFIVSPVLDLDVVRAAVDADVAVLPGVHTPTEMVTAYRAGAPLQKLFPAPGIGPAYVRACLGPLPFLRLVPTNGITPENASAWLGAGAFALGINSAIFDAAELAERRFDRIEERSRQVLAAVAAVA